MYQVEYTTSSGRRSKKRNMDEHDGSVSGMKKATKSRSGKKTSKRSSKANNLRTQRAAARNALNMFSQISGTSTDEEDEEDEDDYSSEDELMEQDFSSQNTRSDRNVHTLLQKNGNERCSSSNASSEQRPTAPNVEHRKRLIVKFPIRDPNHPSTSVMPTDIGTGLDTSFDPLSITRYGKLRKTLNFLLMSKF